MTAPSLDLVGMAAQAAARLNLTLGRDHVWRGGCPACGYGKPTLEMRVEADGIAVSCVACGRVTGIAAMMGLPAELVMSPRPSPSKVARALETWRKAAPATGTLVEAYLRGRGITLPMPASIRFQAATCGPLEGLVMPRPAILPVSRLSQANR
jgi:hypothetical protein